MTSTDIPRGTIPDADPDDVRLMAHADGELSGAEAAAVAAAIAADPDLARRHAVYVATRARLADVAAATGDAALPAALQARVADMVAAHRKDRAAAAAVVPLPVRARSAPAWSVSLAASVALVVGLGAGLLITGGRPVESVAGPFDSAAVQDALGRLATGDGLATDAGELRVLSSFRDRADTLCREAAVSPVGRDGALAVLCRAPDGRWQVDLMLRQQSGQPGDGLSTASGLGALDGFLADIGAGPPLDAETEARALAE